MSEQSASTNPSVLGFPASVAAWFTDENLPQGRWVITGGPGSGRSTLLHRLAIQEIRRGTAADRIALLTPTKPGSRRASAAVREGLLRSEGEECDDTSAGSYVATNDVLTAPLAQSVHSLAFAILHRDAAAEQTATPRLLTGAEHDAIIRELLTGLATDERLDNSYWPERLRPALSTLGMARGLRDLLLRAAERGLGPTDLQQLGATWSYPEWKASGIFWQSYEEMMRLRDYVNVNASELIHKAVQVLNKREGESDWDLFDVVLVDDAQQLDPLSSQLIEAISKRSRLTVVAGDNGQMVFHFRGADTSSLDQRIASERWQHIRLPGSHRLNENTAAIGIQVAEAIGNPDTVRWARDLRKEEAEADTEADEVADEKNTVANSITIVPDIGTELAVIADHLRRAHIESGVAWRDCAVIVRSRGDIDAIRRTLISAGVPVHSDPEGLILAEQPLVSALLQAVRCAQSSRLNANEMTEFALSPLGGADPITLRRTIRALRRAHLIGQNHGENWALTWPHATSEDATESAICWLNDVFDGTCPPELLNGLSERERELIDRLQSCISAGRQALSRGDGIELVLWEIWAASGLDQQLATISLRAGARGSVADQHLDAVMSLFDAAGDFVERFPHATVNSFVTFIQEQELPTGGRERRGAHRDAVEIIAAHSAVGREWDTVVVSGLNEGHWPNLRLTGTLLKQEDLVDLLDADIEPRTPGRRAGRIIERRMEEHRLFYLAVTRATRSLLVTAIGPRNAAEASDDDERSRFLRDLTITQESVTDAPPVPKIGGSLWSAEHPMRMLSPVSVIAELRSVVANSDAPTIERQQAAYQLARMAQIGGALKWAHPEHWWGLKPISTTDPLRPIGRPINVSPSMVSSVIDCPLGATMERLTGIVGDTAPLNAGTLFHACVEALEKGADSDAVEEILLHGIADILSSPPWRQQADQEDWKNALGRVQQWLTSRSQKLAEGGIEVPFEVVVGTASNGDPVQLRGRIDRLEVNEAGVGVPIDFKTSAAAVSAAEHPQLHSYQTAIAAQDAQDRGVENYTVSMPGTGQWFIAPNEPSDLRTGGALLVFPRHDVQSVGKIARDQAAMPPQDVHEWMALIISIAEAIRGPELRAAAGCECDWCNRLRVDRARYPEPTTLTYGRGE